MKRTTLALLLSFAFAIVSGQTPSPQWTIYNTSNSTLPHNTIRDIATGPLGPDLLLATGGGGLATAYGSTFQPYNTANSGLPWNDVRATANGNNNHWWAAGDSGVFEYDSTKWIRHSSVWSCSQDIIEDASGNIWAGGWNGKLAKYDGSNWTEYNPSNSGLPNNTVLCIAIDGSGNKWIGTDGGGLIMFDGSTWTVYNKSNSGLPSDFVTAIAVEGGDSIWVGADSSFGGNSGGLVLFNGTTWTNHSANLPRWSVSSIAIDAGGNKWIGIASKKAPGGFSGGLVKFDGTAWTYYNTSNSALPSDEVLSVAIDKKESVWAGTNNGLAKICSAVTPVINAGGPTTFCKGGNVTLTSSIDSTAGIYYSWSSLPVTKSISVSSSGTYTLTVTNSKGCAAISAPVTISAIDLTVDLGVDKTMVCGDSVQLDAMPVYNGTQPFTYSWSPSTGLSSTAISNPYAKISVSKKYYVSITDGLCTTTDSISLIVNPVTVDAGTDKTIVCGGSVQLNATHNYPGSGTLSYTWSPSSGLSSASVSNPTATLSSSQTYTVTVSDGICTSSDSVKVNVNPIVISPGSDKTTVCGTLVQLNAPTNYTGAGTLAYTWSPPTGLSATNISNPQSNPSATTTYTVSVTDGASCSATATIKVNLTTQAAPSICIVSVDSATKKNMIVWEKGANKNAITSYKIYRETTTAGVYTLAGTVPANGFSTFIDFSSNPEQQADRYKIAFVDTCGLETLLGTEHKTMHLTINAGTGGKWNLIWDGYEGFYFTSYNIYRGTTSGNLVKIGSIQNTLTSYTDGSPPAGNIFYAVETINPSGCVPSAKMSGYGSSLSNIADNNSIGFRDNENFISNIDVYPNPGSGQFAITLYSMINQDIQVKIFTAEGQKVFDNTWANCSGNYKQHIDMSGFAKGVYFMQLSSEKSVAYKKIILQ